MEDGSIIEVECNDEVWNGNYLKYFSTGKIQETGQYQNDKRDGRFLIYNNDSKNTLRKEMFYKNSPDPIYVIEYEHIDGQLVSSTLYVNKVLTEIKSYFETGEIESIKNFKDNKITNYDKFGNVLIDKYQISIGQKFQFSQKGKFADARELIYKYADNPDKIKKNSQIYIGEDTLEQKFNVSRLRQDLEKRSNKLKIIQIDKQYFLEYFIGLFNKPDSLLDDKETELMNQIKLHNKLEDLESELKRCIEFNAQCKINKKQKIKMYFLTHR